MRFLLRALAMLAAVALVVGTLAVALFNQVLAILPTSTPEPTAEDMARLREALPLPCTRSIDNHNVLTDPTASSAPERCPRDMLIP